MIVAVAGLALSAWTVMRAAAARLPAVRWTASSESAVIGPFMAVGRL